MAVKPVLFGCIGLVVAYLLRVAFWFVSTMPHGSTGLTAHSGGSRYGLLQDPAFLGLAVLCVGLGLYLGKP
jgi:hypothetical protein